MTSPYFAQERMQAAVIKRVFVCLVTFITYVSYSRETSDNFPWVIEKSTPPDVAHLPSCLGDAPHDKQPESVFGLMLRLGQRYLALWVIRRA